MASALLRGLVAGAAGTTALNSATYLDMALRGRGSSSTPQQVVAESAKRIGVTIPGDQDSRENRLQGLGPLSGTAVGMAVGAISGVIQELFARRGRRIPAPVAIPLIGAAAMAMSDVPMKALGISDPRSWPAKDWASDAIPHLAYGTVTYAALRSPRS